MESIDNYKLVLGGEKIRSKIEAPLHATRQQAQVEGVIQLIGRKKNRLTLYAPPLRRCRSYCLGEEENSDLLLEAEKKTTLKISAK